MSEYKWLLIGAAVGFLFVLASQIFFLLQIDGWLAATVTTICAIVSVYLGPTITGVGYADETAAQAQALALEE